MTTTSDVCANTSVMSASLAEVDPDIAELLDRKLGRQRDTLEMIASENFAPRSVLQLQGSVLTNKYAEGLPGRRHYGGCEHVDVIENTARDLVSTTVHKTLGGARSGLILGKQEFAKSVNSSVFPGTQGGPAMQVVAAKATTGHRRRQCRCEGGQRRHRRTSGPRRSAEFAARRQGRRGPAPPDRHHRQPQRRAQRSRAADGDVRPAHRHAGAGPSADIAALRGRVTRLAREFPLYERLDDWELHGKK